jgi:hypothetical protein
MKISSKIKLPPDNRSDEIAVQILTCSKCNFQGIAVYEESRRGSFDYDSFSHQGYFVASDLLNDVKDVINARAAHSYNLNIFYFYLHSTTALSIPHAFLIQETHFSRALLVDDHFHIFFTLD